MPPIAASPSVVGPGQVDWCGLGGHVPHRRKATEAEARLAGMGLGDQLHRGVRQALPSPAQMPPGHGADQEQAPRPAPAQHVVRLRGRPAAPAPPPTPPPPSLCPMYHLLIAE